MNYLSLRKVNVNEHIEKKNGLSYLSWAWAVDTLLQNDSAATWTYGEPVKFGETLMVFCTVTAFGKNMTAQLPVMDYRNKAIPNPDAMSVNTAMQRCLAKAIALHGLGLYIYAGEDLPEEDAAKKPETLELKMPKFSHEEMEILGEMAAQFAEYVAAEKFADAHALGDTLDNEQKLAMWGFLDSKTRTSFKKYQKGN
jgi:hypothetical protein